MKIRLEVEDALDLEVSVPALPQIGAIMDLGTRGAFKVREAVFAGGADGGEMQVTLKCVPVLHF
jgi:hypothetical protein